MEGYEMHALRGSREQRRVLRRRRDRGQGVATLQSKLSGRVWITRLGHEVLLADRHRNLLCRHICTKKSLHHNSSSLAKRPCCIPAQNAGVRRLHLITWGVMYSKNTRSCNPGLRALRRQDLKCKTPKLRIALQEAEEQLAQQANRAQCCARSSEELQAETYRLRQMALDDDIKRKNMLELFADQAKQMAAHTQLQRRRERQSMPWNWWPLKGGVHWCTEMRDWKKSPFWLLNIETYIQGICERICSNYFTFAATTVQTPRLGLAWLECFCFFLGGGGGWGGWAFPPNAIYCIKTIFCKCKACAGAICFLGWQSGQGF